MTTEPTQNSETDALGQMLEVAQEHLEQGDADGARGVLASWMKAAGVDSVQAPAEVRLLGAACDRLAGDVDSAVAVLDQLTQEEDDWATPALWLSEIWAEKASAQEDGALSLEQARSFAEMALERADDEEEFLDAILNKADVELELDRPDWAAATLAELPPAEVLAQEPEYALEAASLFAEMDEDQSALNLVAPLLSSEDSVIRADALYLKGAMADKAGDDAARDEAWVAVRALDQEWARDDDSHELTTSEAEEAARLALEDLPAVVKQKLSAVPVSVLDLPAIDDVRNGLDPRLLACFRDVSPDSGPKEIVIYRSNLERATDDVSEAQEEVLAALLHEASLHFDLDEIFA